MHATHARNTHDVARAFGPLLGTATDLPQRPLPTRVVGAEGTAMDILWGQAYAHACGLLVATFDPHTTPWVRAVFDPSHRAAVPQDTGHVPSGERLPDYTPMPFQDPCQGVYQRFRNTVVRAAEDHDTHMPLHTKGVLLVDTDGWALFFEAEPGRWAHRPETMGQEALFVFTPTTSAHAALRLHTSVARRMAQIQPLLTALIGRSLPFAPTFVPIPR